MLKIWEAAQRHWVIAVILSLCVGVAAVVGFMGNLAAIWSVLSKDTVPDFMAKKGWLLTGWSLSAPPLVSIVVMVACIGILLAQIALLSEAWRQRTDRKDKKNALAFVADIKAACGYNQLRFLAPFTPQGGDKPVVTIRWVGYGPDYQLVQRIESIFREHCSSWKVNFDTTNTHELHPDPDCKVRFDYTGMSVMGLWVLGAFQVGELLGAVTVRGRKNDYRDDWHRLIIEVLPNAS